MSSAEHRENRTLGRSASGDGRNGGPVTVPTSCFFNSLGELGVLLTRAYAFVPVERSLRARVGLVAPLRDKITSSAQSLVPRCAHRRLRTAQESYSPCALQNSSRAS